MNIPRFCPPLYAAAMFVMLSQPALGQVVDKCDDAFAAQHWTDVVDFCTAVETNVDNIVAHGKNLTDTDRLAFDEILVMADARIARAQLELGNLKEARLKNQEARVWLNFAELYGLSRDSSRYKSLKASIDEVANALGP